MKSVVKRTVIGDGILIRKSAKFIDAGNMPRSSSHCTDWCILVHPLIANETNGLVEHQQKITFTWDRNIHCYVTEKKSSLLSYWLLFTCRTKKAWMYNAEEETWFTRSLTLLNWLSGANLLLRRWQALSWPRNIPPQLPVCVYLRSTGILDKDTGHYALFARRVKNKRI